MYTFASCSEHPHVSLSAKVPNKSVVVIWDGARVDPSLPSDLGPVLGILMQEHFVAVILCAIYDFWLAIACF